MIILPSFLVNRKHRYPQTMKVYKHLLLTLAATSGLAVQAQQPIDSNRADSILHKLAHAPRITETEGDAPLVLDSTVVFLADDSFQNKAIHAYDDKGRVESHAYYFWKNGL